MSSKRRLVTRRVSEVAAALTRHRIAVIWLLVAFGAAAVIVGVGSTRTAAKTTGAAASRTSCEKFAATSGVHFGSGSRQRPYRRVQKLVDSLRPGSTGCLLPGVYTENVRIARGGTRRRPITLTSARGGRATLRGRLYVTDDANDVVISRLNLDGRNRVGASVSPIVNGDRIVFRDNDVTSYNTVICFGLGNIDYGIAKDVVIEQNRIHNCGALPPTNHGHGIYVTYARRTIIRDNYIYDNADRGIQLYPDAQNSRIVHNVIDRNGEGIIISGSGEHASSGNYVAHNIVTNSTIRYNVEYYWPAGSRPGRGNVVERNCVWNGAKGNIKQPQIGVAARKNIVSDPLYRSPRAKDFRLRRTSPCAGMQPRVHPARS